MEDLISIAVAMLILYTLSYCAYIDFVDKYNSKETKYHKIANSLYIANICSLILAVFTILCIIISIIFE